MSFGAEGGPSFVCREREDKERGFQLDQESLDFRNPFRQDGCLDAARAGDSCTSSVKMAALTLLVQESPAHNMTALDTLVTMAKKKGKREAMLASGLEHWIICSQFSQKGS